MGANLLTELAEVRGCVNPESIQMHTIMSLQFPGGAGFLVSSELIGQYFSWFANECCSSPPLLSGNSVRRRIEALALQLKRELFGSTKVCAISSDKTIGAHTSPTLDQNVHYAYRSAEQDSIDDVCLLCASSARAEWLLKCLL